MSEVNKTLVQCDFDGTITEEDVSFMMLDTFASGDWRQIFRNYEEGKISVGRFNTEAEIDTVVEQVVAAVRKLRELSPLYEMAQEGIDPSKVQWSRH